MKFLILVILFVFALNLQSTNASSSIVFFESLLREPTQVGPSMTFAIESKFNSTCGSNGCPREESKVVSSSSSEKVEVKLDIFNSLTQKSPLFVLSLYVYNAIFIIVQIYTNKKQLE